jgi:hypothetical protein
VHLSRVLRSLVGSLLGALMVAFGVGYIFGLGWSLIVGGAAMVLYFLLVYNVDEPT